MSKVLFVYPNKEGYPIIPLGISILSGILKRSGHYVDLYDATFKFSERIDHDAREKTGVVQKVDVKKYWGEGEAGSLEEGFKKKINDFGPDLIAFSVVENNYSFSKKLVRAAREVCEAPILAGGLFPTIRPDLFLEPDGVDMVCVGEGERSIEKLAEQLDGSKDFSQVPNLILRGEKRNIPREFAPYYDWNPWVAQDWGIFDERHLLKPFMGKMWKTGFFELARGCPYGCSYCSNDLCQKLFKRLGRYNREKPIEYAIREMEVLKKAHSLELIFFNDENFLTMRRDRLEEFCRQYQSKIGLPFFIATRADSLLDEAKVAMLREAGCVTIGIGVECGNEEMRNKLLKKNIPNSVYERAFANCHKQGIRTTANIMMGLPFETEEHIFESARFCRKLGAKSLSLAIFAPYQGTVLRELCVRNNFIEDRLYEDIAIVNHSVLNMPQLTGKRIEELYCQFNDLVYNMNRSAERHPLVDSKEGRYDD